MKVKKKEKHTQPNKDSIMQSGTVKNPWQEKMKAPWAQSRRSNGWSKMVVY